MNLSFKKLRRGATVVGGSLLGLGIAAAMATPALACNSEIKGVASCLAADGTWSVTWSVTSDVRGTEGTITYVDETPVGAPLTKIIADKDHPVVIPAQGQAPLTGVESLKSTDTQASIAITAKYDGIRKPVTAKSNWVSKPTELCAPASTPPTTKPTTAPPTTPPTTKPATTSPTTTASASAAPSSSGPVLAVTGSSSAPLAGGAVAVVLIGGGAFFLARRRKVKFTA